MRFQTLTGLLAVAVALAVPAIAATVPVPSSPSKAELSGLTCRDPDHNGPNVSSGKAMTIPAKSVKPYKSSSSAGTMNDAPIPVIKSTTDTLYLAPGVGACSAYRDSSMTACIDPNWTLPNKGGFPCDAWIELSYGNKTVQLRVQDKCPGAGCDGIYISKRPFLYLAGDSELNSGHLEAGKVVWRWLDNEPWWACYAGLPGNTLDGKRDACTGPDDYKCSRSGRKRGSQRVVGKEVYKSCPAYPNPYR